MVKEHQQKEPEGMANSEDQMQMCPRSKPEGKNLTGGFRHVAMGGWKEGEAFPG